MSMTLSNFLIEASQNPALLRRLREAPEAVAAEASLTESELGALLSEDATQVYRALEDGVFAPLPLMLCPQTVVDN